jgi:uncharacterized protein YegP (UPF0339 family)
MNQTKFEFYRDIANQYRWRLLAGNGEIVAVSEAYTELANAKRSALRVAEIANHAILVNHANLA